MGKCGSKFTYQNLELGVVKHEPVWGFLIPSWYRIVVMQHESWKGPQQSSAPPLFTDEKTESPKVNVHPQDHKAKKQRNAFLYALCLSIETDLPAVVGKN